MSGNSLTLVLLKTQIKNIWHTAKVNIKSEKMTPFGEIYYASKAFYALFMRFHLTKSSTALLVFAVLPTTTTSGTR